LGSGIQATSSHAELTHNPLEGKRIKFNKKIAKRSGSSRSRHTNGTATGFKAKAKRDAGASGLERRKTARFGGSNFTAEESNHDFCNETPLKASKYNIVDIDFTPISLLATSAKTPSPLPPHHVHEVSVTLNGHTRSKITSKRKVFVLPSIDK